MERRFGRVAAAAGFVFVAMTVVGVGLYPNVQPPYDEAAIRAGYIEGAAAASWSAVLQLFGIIPFTIFLVGVWQRLRGTAESLATIALLGGFGTMVVIHIWQGIIVGVMCRPTSSMREPTSGPSCRS